MFPVPGPNRFPGLNLQSGYTSMLSNMLKARFSELGKIKIGGLGEKRKSQSGGEYRLPMKHDHFTLTTLERNKDGDLTPDVGLMESLKDFRSEDGKLRRLPIVLLSNTVEDVMQAAYLWFVGKRLAGRSDGVKATVYYDRTKKTQNPAERWLAEPVTGDWDPSYLDLKDERGHPTWKLHATFNCVVASPLAKWGGYYKFRTTSQISGDQLYGSLLYVRQLTGGVLRGIPFEMVLRPIQVNPEGTATIVYVVHLEIVGHNLAAIQAKARDQMNLELGMAKQTALATLTYKKLITTPDEFADDAELAEVVTEFHGDTDPEPEPPPPPENPAPARETIKAEPPKNGKPNSPAADKALVEGVMAKIDHCKSDAERLPVWQQAKADPCISQAGRTWMKNELAIHYPGVLSLEEKAAKGQAA